VQRHIRAGRIEERDGKFYATSPAAHATAWTGIGSDHEHLQLRPERRRRKVSAFDQSLQLVQARSAGIAALAGADSVRRPVSMRFASKRGATG
jgi:hypothetical protein